MHYGYQRPCRPVAQRAGPFRRRPAGAVLRRGPAGRCVYILCIGPGDYFFLRKFVRRMEWTWLTFPGHRAAVQRRAYVMAHRLKGDQLRVCQVDLVDVDASRERARHELDERLQSAHGDLQPRRCAPRLPDGRPADARRHDDRPGWGCPATGWAACTSRAAGSRAGGTAAVERPVRVRAGAGCHRRRAHPGLVQQELHRPLVGRRARRPSKRRLVDEDRVPRGTVTNRLDFPLADCILAYDR